MADDQPSGTLRDDAPLTRYGLPFCLAAAVVLPTILAFCRVDAGPIWAVATACVAAAVLIRLHDVVEFEFGPLKARLLRATAKAEATVEQLQNLAVGVARPALGALMAQGRFGGGDLRKRQFDAFEQVMSDLRKLDVSPDQIRSAASLFENYVRLDMVGDLRNILHNELMGKPEHEKMSLCFHAPFNRIFSAQESSKLRPCLEAVAPIQGEAAETLLDLEQFERDGTLRRPDVFFQRGDR